VAIGRHTREEVTIILPTDSALPQTVEGLEAYNRYSEDGFNEELLAPVMNGGKPTRFCLQRLSYAARKRSDELQEHPVERSEFILRAALKRVDGFELRGQGGRVSYLRQPEFEAIEPWGELVTARWLADADLPTDVINLLAGTARLLSEGLVPFAGSSSTPSTDSESGASGESEKSATG
jgi:hypothetical protein